MAAGADPKSTPKAAGAFRTIGEVSAETGVAQHVLRYWETRFPQLRPVTRAGGRRYYRPEDVALVARIKRLLEAEGYTIKGVQQVLARRDPESAAIVAPAPPAPPASGGDPLDAVRAVRDRLARALADD